MAIVNRLRLRISLEVEHQSRSGRDEAKQKVT
jgi:hypothetical protein